MRDGPHEAPVIVGDLRRHPTQLDRDLLKRRGSINPPEYRPEYTPTAVTAARPGIFTFLFAPLCRPDDCWAG